MADLKKNAGKGSKKLKRAGRQNNKDKYARYKAVKHQTSKGKKIVGSREHRGRGPLTLYIQFQKALAAAYAKTHSGRDGCVVVLNGKIIIVHPE